MYTRRPGSKNNFRHAYVGLSEAYVVINFKILKIN